MSRITLKLDAKKVSQAEEEYKKLKITPEQRQLIDQIAQMMQQFVPIPVMAIKGNTWLSIKQWQTNNKMMIESITKMNPEQRLKSAKELFDLGKERMVNMLANPEEQKNLLDEAYEKAWNVYQQHVNKAGS